MDVVDADGAALGDVKEVRPGDFLLARPLHRDVYVPFNAVRQVDGLVVVLDIGAGAIGDMGWARPALLGGAADTQILVEGDERPPAAAKLPPEGPLDTRPGRTSTSGSDDGKLPPAADLLDHDEIQRRRDLAG